MEIKEKQKLKKNLPRFFCDICDFKCYMKCDWERHITRPKHLNAVEGNVQEIKNLKKTYFCDCGKNFLSNSGLWKHKKVCNAENTNDAINKIIDKDELILTLIKQNFEITKENSEFKNMMMKVIENGTTNHSHNTTNSHNKSFNLQFFLNETCKDAMNIMDFVEE